MAFESLQRNIPEQDNSNFDGYEEKEHISERTWREEKAPRLESLEQKDLQNSSSSNAKEGKKPCAFYARGHCNRGEGCKFLHATPAQTIAARRVWLKFCEGYAQEQCNDSNCRYLHVSPEDEELYKSEGVIAMDVLAQAVRKAYLLGVPLEVNKPVCKENLDDSCAINDCPSLHWNREEFLYKVLGKVKSEFLRLCGPPELEDDDCSSEEIQSDIIQKLLKPSAPKFGKEFAPFMKLVPLFPPGMFPASLSVKRDCNNGNVSGNLGLANEQLAEENEKYGKYVQALEEENRKIREALDPEQPSADLKDIRKRLLHVFEAINSRSSAKLIGKSLDEYKNLETQTKGIELGTQMGQQGTRGDPYNNSHHSDEDNDTQERSYDNDTQERSYDSRRHERRGHHNDGNPLKRKRKDRKDVKWYKSDMFESTLESLQKPHLDWLFRKLLGCAGVIGEEVTEKVSKDGIKKKKKKISEPCKVFAYSFSEAHTKPVVKEYFDQFGEVRALNYRKYFAWINFSHPSAVDKLINHDKPHVIEGYEIFVMRKDDKHYTVEQNLSIVGGNRKPPEEAALRKPGEVVFRDLTDEHDLESMEKYFWKFGKLLRFVCHNYRGFVVYEDCAVAYDIINQIEPHVVNGVAITVLPHAPTGWFLKPRKKDSVFVGDLERSVTEADLENYFSTFGKIEEIDLKKNKRGLCRGYGFVTFLDSTVAENVLTQESHEIKGKTVRVKPTMHHVRRLSKKYLQSEQNLEKETSEDSDDDEDETMDEKMRAQEELRDEYDLMHAKELGLMDDEEFQDDDEELEEDEDELQEDEEL